MGEPAGTWIETCGCGRETRVKNLRYLVSGGDRPCDAPHPHRDDPDDVRPHVVTEAGWCGCGSPEDIDAMMLAYLASREGMEFPRLDPVGVSGDATILLARLSDRLGWTEHGTVITGDWLTDDGAAALAVLRSRPLTNGFP